MALLDSEGFGFSTSWSDYAAYTRWQTVNVPPTVLTGGPLGDNYLGGGAQICYRRLFPSAMNGFFVGFRVVFGTNNGVVYLSDPGGGELFHILVSATGALSVVRNTTTLFTTAPGAVPVNSTTWGYMQIGAVLSTTTGSITILYNNVPIVSLSGINNTNSGSTSMQFLQVGDTSGSAHAPVGFMHMYCCDNTGGAPWNSFLGEVRVQTLPPLSNNAVAFTPNGLGTNWQNAAKIPPVPGTDFNSSSTVGAQDTFNCGAVSAGLQTIYGVHVKALMTKNDAGQRSGVALVVSGGIQAASASLALSLSPQQIKLMLQTDPATSAQWAWAAVNAANPGYAVSA